MPNVLFYALAENERKNLIPIEVYSDSVSKSEDFICSIFELGEVSPTEAKNFLEKSK